MAKQPKAAPRGNAGKKNNTQPQEQSAQSNSLNADLFKTINQSSANSTGKTTVPASSAGLAELIAAGYVAANPAGPDADGNLECAPTNAGKTWIADITAPEDASMNTANAGSTVGWTPQIEEGGPTASAANPAQGSQAAAPGVGGRPRRPILEHEIVTLPEIPKAAPRAAAQSAYPFEQLDVGQAIAVYANEQIPNPARDLNSLVSAASKRLSPRHFVLRAFTDQFPAPDGSGRAGAFIARTADQEYRPRPRNAG